MIPTHDGDELLAETLASVLRQDPGPDHMQIEVVDDHSTTTDPESVVRRLGGERVTFHRQPANVGHTANFNTCLVRARGQVVHVLHDDDLVRPGFYAALEPALRDDATMGAAITRHVFADAGGHWRSLSPLERSTPGIVEDWLLRIAAGMRTTTPAVVIRRSVFEDIGGFDPRIRGGEDWEMYVRVATRYPVWFEPEPLAVYRYARPGSLTGDAVGSTVLVEDMLRAAEVIATYLPDYLPADEAARVLDHARRVYGRWSLEAVPELVAGRRWRAAAASLRAGMTATSPLRMTGALLEVVGQSMQRRLQRVGR
jgi:glycosyltransferase involved in cell wall biosynthesis